MRPQQRKRARFLSERSRTRALTNRTQKIEDRRMNANMNTLKGVSVSFPFLFMAFQNLSVAIPSSRNPREERLCLRGKLSPQASSITKGKMIRRRVSGGYKTDLLTLWLLKNALLVISATSLLR